MAVELAIGFTIVIVSLLVMGILVFASRAIVERIHRETEESDSNGTEQ
jgi:hypothetical protein